MKQGSKNNSSQKHRSEWALWVVLAIIASLLVPYIWPHQLQSDSEHQSGINSDPGDIGGSDELENSLMRVPSSDNQPGRPGRTLNEISGELRNEVAEIGARRAIKNNTAPSGPLLNTETERSVKSVGEVDSLLDDRRNGSAESAASSKNITK